MYVDLISSLVLLFTFILSKDISERRRMQASRGIKYRYSFSEQGDKLILELNMLFCHAVSCGLD